MEAVKNGKATVPVHLKDAHYPGAAKLGHGIGYEYAHDFPKHFSHQRYLPEELGETKFYRPSGNGYEKEIDPDAAVYYLARMLYAGESVTFIARRIMICASEDVGNADRSL